MITSSRLLNYMQNNKKTGEFGIKYLDDKLRGILKGDLILIGARSGAGKSTLAEMIASHNAKKGYKVHLFSLENFEDDGFVTKAYYKYKELTRNYDLQLRDFVAGDFDMDSEAFVQSEQYAKEIYSKFTITPRRGNYTVSALCEDIVKVAREGLADLIILDHLDYVDKENPNENDNTHMTSLMKSIRQAQDLYKVAVVAFSHLRKSNGNQKDLPIIPSVDEFCGSSNKVKEATAVVMVAPYDEQNENEMSQRKATWFSIKKLRMGGIDNKNGLVYFDRRIGEYDDKYTEHVVRGKEVREIR